MLEDNQEGTTMTDINLKLKQWSCYEVTPKGCIFYTERDFKVFVPNRILKKVTING